MTLEALLAAAERACSAHDDSDAARAEMWAECTAVPTHQRADLHAYFVSTYEAPCTSATSGHESSHRASWQ